MQCYIFEKFFFNNSSSFLPKNILILNQECSHAVCPLKVLKILYSDRSRGKGVPPPLLLFEPLKNTRILRLPLTPLVLRLFVFDGFECYSNFCNNDESALHKFCITYAT